MRKRMIKGTLLCMVLSIAVVCCCASALAASSIPILNMGFNTDWVTGTITPAQPVVEYKMVLTEPAYVKFEAKTSSDETEFCVLGYEIAAYENLDPFDDSDRETWDEFFEENYHTEAPLHESGETFVSNTLLNAGTYYFAVGPTDFLWSTYSEPLKAAATFQLKATTTALKDTEVADKEPNNSRRLALPLSIGTVAQGLLADGDYDYYSFTVDANSKYDLSMRQYATAIGFELIKLGETRDKDILVLIRNIKGLDYLPQPKTYTKSVALPVGNYMLRLECGAGGNYAFYDLKMKRTGSAGYSLVLPKTLKATPGFPRTLTVTANPVSFPVPAVTFTSSKPSVASVDASTGVVTPLKKGTAVITAKGGGKKATCTVTVAANTFSRKNPLKGNKTEVTTSTKSLKYVGGKVVASAYLYNRSGKTVTGFSNLNAWLCYRGGDDELDPDTLGKVEIGAWSPKGGKLKNNAYAIVTVTFEGDKVANLDLSSGNYSVVLTNDNMFNGDIATDYRGISARGGVRPLAFESRQIVEDALAQPGEAYVGMARSE